MTLRLHYHPLSSYCWKVLIALHENDTPFEPVLVDLSKEEDRNAFYALWPIGKFPVVEDTARNNWFVPESSIIIEYPNQHYPGRTKLIPADPDAARQTRMRDRFFDLHVHNHMQKIIADRLRPQGANDTIGVSMARSQMDTALGMVERQIGDHWTMGESFTMADCAAAPALYYANLVAPLEPKYPRTLAYLARLMARRSFARVLKDAEPYFDMFPKD